MKLRDNHHIVLTTPDIDRCLRFYHDVLSMEAHEKDGQICLYFGSCEITLKKGLTDFAPSAVRMGIINLCLITDDPMEDVLRELEERHAPLVTGIVDRNGARGPMKSIYLIDPDGNFIEIARYADKTLRKKPHFIDEDALASE